MIVRFGLLRRGPVFLNAEPGSAGAVKAVVMQPASFRVVAFSVQRQWWHKPQWFVPAAIASMTAEATRLSSDTAPPAETVLAGARVLKGQPVQTTSRVRLGRVRDFTFSAGTGEVVEISVASFLPGPCWPRECVIERAAVVRMEPKRIIVRDSVILAPGSKVALKSLHS